MSGLNRVILAGRLISDPVVHYTAEETPVACFRMAVNWKNKDAKGTDFISCVAWNGLAKICGEYLSKGKLVAVEGKLNINSASKTEIVVENMQMLDSKFHNANKKGGEK